MTRRRLLLAGTIAVAGALCLFWIGGAWIGWSICCWLISMNFALALTVGAAVNVFGLLAFLVRRQRWGIRILGAVEVGNILFALAASVLVSPTWLWLDAAPAAVTLILIFALARADARFDAVKQDVER
jgi:uncharacterized membrane protein